MHSFCFSKSLLAVNQYKDHRGKSDSKMLRVKPNPKQQRYIEHLSDERSSLVFGYGPAGTGKTLFACKVGMDKLLNDEVSKLIITRPTVSLGSEMGYLPGSIDEKMNPWMIPIYDSFLEQIDKKTLNQYLYNEIIEICPLAYVRGRTFKHAYVIADEMQNATPSEMKTLLTRVGKLSKIVITGDLRQSDIHGKNGLDDILTKLKEKEYNMELINTIEFDVCDVERSELVREVLRLYD